MLNKYLLIEGTPLSPEQALSGGVPCLMCGPGRSAQLRPQLNSILWPNSRLGESYHCPLCPSSLSQPNFIETQDPLRCCPQAGKTWLEPQAETQVRDSLPHPRNTQHPQLLGLGFEPKSRPRGSLQRTGQQLQSRRGCWEVARYCCLPLTGLCREGPSLPDLSLPVAS